MKEYWRFFITFILFAFLIFGFWDLYQAKTEFRVSSETFTRSSPNVGELGPQIKLQDFGDKKENQKEEEQKKDDDHSPQTQLCLENESGQNVTLPQNNNPNNVPNDGTNVQRNSNRLEANNKSQIDKAFPFHLVTLHPEKEDNWFVVTNPDSLLVLVNHERKLPKGFVPKQLTKANIRFSFSGESEKKKLRFEAARAIEQMFKEAEKEGYILYGVSGYRSENTQKHVFERHVNQMGKENAEHVSAYPGSSEHQTGLAIDITSQSVNFLLTQKFGETPEGKWVANNAHRFGFIVRYPKDKTEITGYTYEPWHLRYVGIEAATYLYENHLTLEEVLK